MAVEDITDADVGQAEREAQADAAKVATLTARVLSGGDVTPEELGQAKQLAEWSALRVEAVRQMAALAAEARRQAACAELRADIDANLPGDALAAALHNVEDAVAGWFTAVDEHNAQLAQWRTRMHNLGIPEHRSPIAPDAAHARLGWADADVYAGRRRLARVEPGVWLTQALEAGRAHCSENHVALHLRTGETPVTLNHAQPDADPYGKLARLADELPEPSAKFFYRGPNGAVIHTDHEYAPEDIQRLNLTTITRQEAWPQ